MEFKRLNILEELVSTYLHHFLPFKIGQFVITINIIENLLHVHCHCFNIKLELRKHGMYHTFQGVGVSWRCVFSVSVERSLALCLWMLRDYFFNCHATICSYRVFLTGIYSEIWTDRSVQFVRHRWRYSWGQREGVVSWILLNVPWLKKQTVFAD